MLGIRQPFASIQKQHLGQFSGPGPDLPLNDELTFGVDNGEIPRSFSLVADKTVPLIGFYARDLEVTSMEVMELFKMNTSTTDDSSNGRAVTAREGGCGRKTGAMSHVVDHTIDLFRRQFAAPVGCPLRFTELSATGKTPEQSTLFRAVELAETDVLSTRLVEVWTMRGLANETVEWERK